MVKWCWEDVVFPVPSTSQPKKQTPSLKWVLLGEDLVISPTYEMGGGGVVPVRFPEGPIARGLDLSWDTSSWFLTPTLVP